MAINNNDSRVRKTKKLIRKGLTQLAKEKSIHKITVKELTELIDINRGTFYLHYKDVDTLVASIEKELCEEFSKLAETVDPKNIDENSFGWLQSLCEFLYENAETCGVLLGPNGDPAFANDMGAIIGNKCLEVFSALYPDLDRAKYDIVYEYCKQGVVGIATSWLTKHPDWSVEEITQLWFTLLAKGVMGVLENRKSTAK